MSDQEITVEIIPIIKTDLLCFKSFQKHLLIILFDKPPPNSNLAL